MKAKNVTISEMDKALNKINVEHFDGNVVWNRFDVQRNHINFTLKVKDSSGKGARRGFTGKKMVSACWHVHGYFFDALLDVQPEARVYSSFSGWIDDNGGNWQDRNIGSLLSPLYYSKACEC